MISCRSINIVLDAAYRPFRLPRALLVQRLGHGLRELPIAKYSYPHNTELFRAWSPHQYRKDEDVTAADVVVQESAFLVRVRMSC